MPTTPTPTSFLDHLTRVGEQTLFEQELRDKLSSGRQLKVKFGIDLTAPSLHIGHAVNLWLMRDLQDMGHKAVIVLGDFTTRIGDPNDRLEARPMHAQEIIKRNAETILAQIKSILRHDNPTLFEVHYNSAWYDQMPLAGFLDMLRTVTHAGLISHQTFQKRIAAHRDIFAHEMLYPVLQGYDSVTLEADIALCGTDQRYNEMIGRQLQEAADQPPQTILTTKLSPGTDGELKQSKSLGNAISLSYSPRDMFMRLMDIPEHLVAAYLRLYTALPMADIDRLLGDLHRNPQALRRNLAHAVVARYHGQEAAQAELAHQERIEARRDELGDLPVVTVYHPHITVLELLLAARPQLGAAACRALIERGAFELNDETFKSPDSHILVKNDDIIAIEKNAFARVMVLQMNEFVSERLLMRPIRVEDIDKVFKVIPQEKVVTYLNPRKRGFAKATAREVVHRVIAKPEPKDEWIWVIARRDNLEHVLGVAHLSNTAGIGTENIWLNEDYHNGGYAEEALAAINDYAFDNMGINAMMFKSSFSFAAAPQDIEVLVRRFTTEPAKQTLDKTPAAGRNAGKKLTRQAAPMPRGAMGPAPTTKIVAVNATSAKPRNERPRAPKSGFLISGKKADKKPPAADKKPDPAPGGPKST